MIVYSEIEQGTPEWDELRLGSIGGSTIAIAVSTPQDKVKGGGRKKLMYRLCGELFSGIKDQSYVSWEMKQGLVYEPEARNIYSLMNLTKVEQVGVIKESDHKHVSPDGLRDSNGMIEIKWCLPSVYMEFRITKKIPSNHMKGMQWGLGIAEREYCDYIKYCPMVKKKLDPVCIVRVYRNDKVIKELNDKSDRFIEEMQLLFITIIKGGKKDAE